MKNNILFPFLKLILVVAFLFTSCEKDDQDQTPEEILQETEITPDTKTTSKASGLVNEKVYRYYQGGASSLHTYRTQSGTGTAIGRYEGIAFVTPVSVSSNFDRNKYNVLYFMIHPQNKDFIMTTSGREFWNLRRQGWKNITRSYVLVQKGPGNGTRQLYRFYNAASSDHLFTRNYSEGINAGLKYEGITGWVK